MGKIINIFDAYKLAKEVDSFHSFSLEYSCSHFIEHDEPDDYVMQVRGKILHDRILPTETLKEICGRFICRIVNIQHADNDGVSTFDVFDSEAELFSIYENIFDADTEDYNSKINDLFHGDIYGHNILVIDRVDILPNYRGHKLGLAVVNELIQILGIGCGLVACVIDPVNWEVVHDDKEYNQWILDMKPSSFISDEVQARVNLSKYFGRLGFVQVNNSPLHVLSTAFNMPTNKDIGFENWIENEYDNLR